MPGHARPLLTLGGAFSVAQAQEAGFTPGMLRRTTLRSPFHGTRADVAGGMPNDLLARCLEVVPRLKPWQFISHDTALGLVGTPLPEGPAVPRLHVSSHRPAREPRTAGIVGHRLQLREPATGLVSGVPVEHPVRAWRQAATLWPLDQLIVAAEYLISGSTPLATADELRDEVELMGDIHHGLLRRALGEVRVGARSPRETILRLLLTRAGLPEPEISYRLSASGHFVAELDLAYPRWRIGIEYDGRVHADDPRQFERDADRWERIRRCGWINVRILRHHLRGNGRIALDLVRFALVEAGWRPGLG